MECMLHQYSNVGYTSNNTKMRFSNNKSHVKRNATCEICAHLITENHDINFHSNSTYDETLSKVLKVTVIKAGIEKRDSTMVKMKSGFLAETVKKL